MIIGVLVAFAILGFGMYFSIKQHDKKMAHTKKKKGKNKYMPQYKAPAGKR
jgi:Tfp pilus assembly protein PilO